MTSSQLRDKKNTICYNLFFPLESMAYVSPHYKPLILKGFLFTFFFKKMHFRGLHWLKSMVEYTYIK